MSYMIPYLQDVLNKDTDVTEEHEVLMKYLVFILALDLHRAHLLLTQGLFRMGWKDNTLQAIYWFRPMALVFWTTRDYMYLVVVILFELYVGWEYIKLIIWKMLNKNQGIVDMFLLCF